MPVKYYAERIVKKGINRNPAFHFEKTGEISGMFHADNGAGHVAAQMAMDESINMAKRKWYCCCWSEKNGT